MRAGIPGIPSPYPIGLALPALYLEDDFVQRFAAALDEVMAPVLLTLDCLEAYLDPALAPDDFLDWLAGWIAAPVDEAWPAALRREVIGRAMELHRWRGTPQGVIAEVRLLAGGAAAGVEVELTDGGGVSWSATPTTTPTTAPPADAPVRVRVRVVDPTAVDQRRLREVVAHAVPAHVRTTVEVVEGP
jgi:phage tail-like protein